MNGARWIEAREARKTWRSVFSHWWAGKQRDPEPEVAPAKAPLVLVGSFDDAERFQQAARAFEAEAFEPGDVDFIRFGAERSSTWRERVRRVLRITCNESPFPNVRNARSCCAGWVVVRSAQRFERACQIIEQFGGTLGLPSAFQQ